MAIRSDPGGRLAAATKESVGGSARWASPSAGPWATSSHRAVSSTRRLRHPVFDMPYQCSASGMSEMRPRWGLSPKSPLRAAGMRIDPAPSLADAAPTSPAATAAPEPPLEPPGVRPRFHGLRVSPVAGDSVNPQIASSGRFVIPMVIAPASSRRWTCTAVVGAGVS
ncbi:MAG: hypothetical protein R8F63_01370 [Acidimicrobiales bacterium]|nr:hypothetical protein [Acidimicrobiales bacterium]